jgi:hypothetical protein
MFPFRIMSAAARLNMVLAMDLYKSARRFIFHVFQSDIGIIMSIHEVGTVKSQPPALAVRVLCAGLKGRKSQPTMDIYIYGIIVLAMSSMTGRHPYIATTASGFPAHHHGTG